MVGLDTSLNTNNMERCLYNLSNFIRWHTDHSKSNKIIFNVEFYFLVSLDYVGHFLFFNLVSARLIWVDY